MKKGINLAIRDTKREVATVINEASLPIAIVEMLLREMLLEVQSLTEQTIEKERQEFEELLKEETEEEV